MNLLEIRELEADLITMKEVVNKANKALRLKKSQTYQNKYVLAFLNKQELKDD